MSLSGEPFQHLKNIAKFGENFARAWESLVARYENKRILIDAQLASLFAIRKVKAENFADIKWLLGDTKEALGALEILSCPVKQWDLIIIFMMVRKLDSKSLKRWEDTLAKTDPPCFTDFETFLVSRIYTLEALKRSLPWKQQQSNTSISRLSGARSYTVAATEQECVLCSSGHYLSSCPKYLEKTHDQRREVVVSKNLCLLIVSGFIKWKCVAILNCRTCRNITRPCKHRPATPIPSLQQSLSRQPQLFNQHLKRSSQELISIAPCNTEQLPEFQESSRSIKVDCIFAQIECRQWPHLQGLKLADPNFAMPGKIDLILGASVCVQILKKGICRGSLGTPIAQKTALRWILDRSQMTMIRLPS